MILTPRSAARAYRLDSVIAVFGSDEMLMNRNFRRLSRKSPLRILTHGEDSEFDLSREQLGHHGLRLALIDLTANREVSA